MKDHFAVDQPKQIIIHRLILAYFKYIKNKRPRLGDCCKNLWVSFVVTEVKEYLQKIIQASLRFNTSHSLQPLLDLPV